MAGAERLQRWLSECGGEGARAALRPPCARRRAGSCWSGGAGAAGAAGRAGSAPRLRAAGAERSAPTLGSSRRGSALRFYADVGDDRFLPVARLPFLPFTKRPRAERPVLSPSPSVPRDLTQKPFLSSPA